MFLWARQVRQMRLITKLRNKAYAKGIEHGRTIGIQAVEAFIHSEIRVLKNARQHDKNLDQRVSELVFVLSKIKGMYDK